MTRFGSLIFCATLGAGLLACGSNGDSTATKNALDLVLLDNAVSGWTIDVGSNKSGTAQPTTGTTAKEVEGLIDGAASAYFTAPYTPEIFVWQNYINTTLPAAPLPDGAHLKLYILQMPSADQASGLYTTLLQFGDWQRKLGTPDDWKPTSPLVGTESRIQDTTTQWWVNFHQDVFYVEVLLDPSAPAPDYTPSNPDLKDETVRFAREVAKKM
jgi:hypothetical protein